VRDVQRYWQLAHACDKLSTRKHVKHFFAIECIENSEKAGKNISMKKADPENKREKTRFEIALLPELRDFIEQESAESGKAMYVVANELIALAIALRQGETLVQQHSPLFNDLIESALRVSERRIASYIHRCMQENCKREVAIARHMVYSLTEKLLGAEFAAQAYESAREKAEKEISKQNKEHNSSSTRASA
jgi:hypothetical protein